jgi:hypothetical protein
MTKDAKVRMTEQLEKATGTEKTERTYGAGFYDMYRRIHLPEGDPNRITDSSQLYGHVGPQPPKNFLSDAQRDLALTPQESNLYQRHLDNLAGPGKVRNADGSISTLFQASVEHDGRFYSIPTVWDGKIIPPQEAIKRAQGVGWDKWPSYASEDEAEKRYNVLHSYMERDVQAYNAPPAQGDLTVSGVDKLNTEIQARKSPEGVAESEMKAQFLKNARAQITGTDEGLHIKDPKGDELYLKFLAQVLPMYDAARKEGKSAPTLFNPDSPDYLGKAIAGFRRPMDQWYADTIHEQASPETFDVTKVKSLADLVTAYRAGNVDKATADATAIAKGWATRKPPAPAMPTVPMSQ